MFPLYSTGLVALVLWSKQMLPFSIYAFDAIFSVCVLPVWVAFNTVITTISNHIGTLTFGIFCNQEDDLEALERAMRQRFKDVSIEVVGCAALFSGRVG